MKRSSTPMETLKPLIKDENAEDIDVLLYRSMIGSLMYLKSSRPDIMFVVCACARFQVTPKVSHLHGVKRIFRYLKGQPKLSLWYPKDSPFDLEAYTDSDYTGASLDRKSTIGGCQFLRSRLISWQCKNQTIVVNSTTKAEYESVVPQPISPTQTPIADEAASTGVDVRYGGATTTGRKIVEIDQDPAISLEQHDVEIQERHEHDMEFDFDLDAAKDVNTAEKDVSTAKPISTAGAIVTTASVAVSTAKDKAAVRLQAELEEEERQRISRVHEAASTFNVKE
ncbi:hypothetical protein Tco_1306007 [Tanacetum coccineum]